MWKHQKKVHGTVAQRILDREKYIRYDTVVLDTETQVVETTETKISHDEIIIETAPKMEQEFIVDAS